MSAILPSFRLKLLTRRLRTQLWFRPALWSIRAIAIALLAASANHVVPEGRLPDVARSTLESLLAIIASSMLTVSTFSLSILVGAFSSASSNATPRATRLVMANDSAQSAIAAFIGSFIFAMIALIALGVGYYGSTGRFVLLLFTIADMAYLIIALLRWIATLSRIGLLSHSVEVVEGAALVAMQEWRDRPGLGATQEAGSAFARSVAFRAPSTGYLEFVDVSALDEIATARGARIHVAVRPGAYVAPRTLLATIEGDAAIDDALARRLAKAFVIGRERTESQDPRFGLIILCEIAQRALSPAINDPGTAILVVTALARVLIDGTAVAPATEQPVSRRVSIVPIDEADFIGDAFEPIARDGAASLEVQIALQKMLALVADNTLAPIATAARRASPRLREHADGVLSLDRQRSELADRVRTLGLDR